MSSAFTTLFDDARAWRKEPFLAFDSFLASDSYQSTNRSSAKLPASHRLRGSSAAVYRVMFKKYLAYTDERKVSFIEATPLNVEEFLHHVLGDSSKDTRSRYARLLERAYARALELGAITANPVSAFTSTTKVGGKNKMPPYSVTPLDVSVLQKWLSNRVHILLEDSGEVVFNWREARDVTMAAISLGAGLRCAELTAMRFRQLKYAPGAPSSSRFEFDVPTYASVSTSRYHQTVASAGSVGAMEAWWQFRINRMPSLMRKDPGNDLVFPAGLTGKNMQTSTLFTNLKGLALDAVKEGALDPSRSWVLSTGATGLRRAFIMSAIAEGRDLEVLTKRLGHWHDRSIRRYSERAALLASIEKHSARTADAR